VTDQWAQPAPRRPVGGLAVAGLICAIIGVLFACCVIGALPAMIGAIFGHVDLARSRGHRSGIAIAAVIAGWFGLVLALFAAYLIMHRTVTPPICWMVPCDPAPDASG
jgi:hypothetical protein